MSSGNKVLCGDISWSLDEKSFEEELKKFGDFHIKEIKIPKKPNGYSSGLAIVELETPEDASALMDAVNRQKIKDRVCYVSFADEKKPDKPHRDSYRRERHHRYSRDRRSERRRYDDYDYDYDDRRRSRRPRHYDYYSDDDYDDRYYRRSSRRDSRSRRRSDSPRYRDSYSPSRRLSPQKGSNMSDSDQ